MHMRRSSRRIEFPSEPRTDVGNATPSIDLPAPSPLVELVAAASGARNADADDAVTLAVRPARDACATTGTTSTASNDASHMTSSSCNGTAIASHPRHGLNSYGPMQLWMLMALYGYGPAWLWPCIVIALYSYDLYSYGLCSYGICSYGWLQPYIIMALYSYGPT